MPTSSDPRQSNGARASNFLSVVEGLFHVMVHPIRTTVNILKMRSRFGQEIANSKNALRDSVIYNVEGVLLLVIVSNLVGGRLSVHLLPEFPHSEEVEAILYAFGSVATGVCGYIAVCALKRRFVPPAETIAAYIYWFGFFEFSVLPVAVLVEKFKIDPESRIGSLIALPTAIAVYLALRVLIRWIADLNDIGWLAALISFGLAILFFNAVFRPLFFIVNLILRRWHIFINPYVN